MANTSSTDAIAWINNSLSVNTHLNWTNVPYTNLTNVFNALHYLGIDNIRDDNSNASILNQVASAGFHQDLMVGSDQGITTVHNLEAAHPGAVRAIEGPNEVNGFGVSYNGQSGYAGAIAFQQHLYQTVNADSVLKDVDVFNTTVSGINDTSKLGNLSGYTDYGNVHDYYGTGYPWQATDPNYTWQKYHDAGNISAPGKPVVVTETGVSTATVSEAKQAATVLDAIMDGAKTNESFINIYELVNSHNAGASDYESNFGLYDWNWNAKPAATALHNFTSILAKDTGAAAGGSLDYSISGVPSAGGEHLFQDHAGNFDIVTWGESTSAAHETVSFASAHDVNVYDPMSGTDPIQSLKGVTSVSVDVTDHPLIIQVSGAGSGASAAATANQSLGTASSDTLTGADGQSNYLRGDAGGDSITGGTGFNDINGNQGNDTIVGHSKVGDWLLGGQGDDSIASQSTVHDLLHGNLGNDTLTAGSGGDTLRGGQADDSIVGGAGNDWLAGDKGHDTLTGGGGADTFHGATGMGVTTITDFHLSEGDRVVLDHGTQYSATQSGADVHVDLTGGGQLILQNTQLSSLTSGWITA